MKFVPMYYLEDDDIIQEGDEIEDELGWGKITISPARGSAWIGMKYSVWSRNELNTKKSIRRPLRDV